MADYVQLFMPDLLARLVDSIYAFGPQWFELYCIFPKLWKLQENCLFQLTQFCCRDPGRSRNPDTVHLPMTFVPKYTSRASFTASTPALDSPLRLRWRWKHTSVVTKPLLLISLEGRAVVFSFGRIGFAFGKPFVEPSCKSGPH
jgi:hypothetical protein